VPNIGGARRKREEERARERGMKKQERDMGFPTFCCVGD
jgi:hypothetical protein